jgi:hypothetical protein
MTQVDVQTGEARKPGYLALHPDPAFNFFMNRMVGTNDPGELAAIGRRITTFEDWVREMTAAAEQAEADGRLLNAAGYWRAVEFYTPSSAVHRTPRSCAPSRRGAPHERAVRGPPPAGHRCAAHR